MYWFPSKTNLNLNFDLTVEQNSCFYKIDGDWTLKR